MSHAGSEGTGIIQNFEKFGFHVLRPSVKVARAGYNTRGRVQPRASGTVVVQYQRISRPVCR